MTTYPLIERFFPNTEPQKFNLLLRKGVFPYDWFDSLEKLNFNKLPEKEAFYSALNGSDISDNDYMHAKKV